MSMEADYVKVFRTRPEAKLPTRAHRGDAGLDIYFCPLEGAAVRVKPGQSVLLETGVKVEVPPECMFQIMNKSGIASKTQLITGACVVDEGYDGEIFVNLQNIGKDIQFIEPGQKIAQGVFVRIEKPVLWEIEEDNIYGKKTARGAGGLGSTGLT
jgi:dUTP pyrophosphatase